MEEEIRVGLVAESGYRRRVEGDAVIEGARELVGHYRDVLLFSVDVAEGEADEFHVLLGDILYNFFFCVLHVRLRS